jgi:hypothetical protein
MIMKPAKTENLDRILGAEEELLPSSGFVASVMDRVRQEAAAPEPIPFPWKRALPGMIVTALGLIWCVVKLVQAGLSDSAAPIVISIHSNGAIASSLSDAGWTAVALGVSLLSWLLARRLIGRAGLV